MPWNESSVPERVKGEKKRRQWMHVANSTLKRTGDEGRAIAAANAVVKKKEFQLQAGEKGYVSGWDTEIRQFPQAAAGYNPLGATDKRGCANCNWFVSPDSCVLVAGDISPTGNSRFYEPKHVYEMEPLPVLVVNADWKEKSVDTIPAVDGHTRVGAKKDFSGGGTGVLGKLIAWAKKATGQPTEARAFVLFDDANGALRFATSFTNNFEDKHTEILCDEAHKEYVSWVNGPQGIYPELQVWHCGSKSKYGQVDFVDYVDGFVVASGVIDEGKEEFAWKVYEGNPGVSHGFVGVKPNGKHWLAYRTFEISTLDKEFASNGNLDVLFTPSSKEFFGMPFDENRKAHLKGLGLTDENIADWEGGIKTTREGLEKAGIQFKSSLEATEPVPGTEAAATPTAATGTTAEIATKSELAFILQGFGDIAKTNAALASGLGTLAESVKSLTADVAALKMPAAEQAAKAYEAAILSNPGGFIATAQKDNVPSGGEVAQIKQGAELEDIFKMIDRAAGIGATS